MTIAIIDPGHGGRSTGTPVPPIHESEYALSVSHRIQQLDSYPDLSVTCTRDTDTYISLPDRAAFARDWYADITVSMHVNAHKTRPDFHGCLIFWAEGDLYGARVAREIMSRWPDVYRRTRGGLWPVPENPTGWLKRPWAILRHHRPHSCIVVEMFHATNDKDLSVAHASDTQWAMARATIEGIYHGSSTE